MAEPPRSLAALRTQRTLVVWTSTTATFVTAAALCWVFAIRDLHPVHAPLRLAWPVLAVAFALGHLANIRVELRKHSHILDLTDVVLLPAIVFVQPSQVVLAAAIGTALSCVWDRQALIKDAFNVSLHAVSASTAVIVFYAVIGGASVFSARGWLAAVVAIVATEIVTAFAIQFIVSLSAARRFPAVPLHRLSFMLGYMITVDLTLGVTAVHLLWASRAGGVIFLVLVAAIAVEYASHGRLRIRHTALEQLLSFEQTLAGMVESDLVIAAVLGEALVLFNAEVAQLVLPDPELTVCYTLRTGESGPIMTTGTHALAALVATATATLLAPRGVRDPQVAEALTECGFRDAIALRLPGDVASVVEVLVVADRLGGDPVSFNAEDVTLAETLATPTAMALRSSGLLEQLQAEVDAKEHQASHDALTGLANRTLFASELDRALSERSPEAFVGVMLVDLDGFKSVNDTLGHGAGDEFLHVIACRLEEVVGDAGTVGRLGGDEFAIVVPDAAHWEGITALASRLDAAVRLPVRVSGTTVGLRASIGVTASPLHAEDRFTLLREADLAMYRAKQHGGGVALHDDHDDASIDGPSLNAALREAIESSLLHLHYQPKVDLRTGTVIGVEALVRWTHPRYGSISPEQFIPAAESSGLIRPLTRWLLEAALAQCSSWRAAGIELNIAVNLSPAQINDPEILRQVTELLEAYELAPGTLTLEITESLAVVDEEGDGCRVLDSLADLGVRIAIDDFGVGTSSLARLKRLPVSEVKIDRSFITDLTHDRKDRVIVAKTVKLLHALGLDVVAEGVEDEATFRRLRAIGCDIAQGYLVSAPLVAEDLVVWLDDRERAALGAVAGGGREARAIDERPSRSRGAGEHWGR